MRGRPVPGFAAPLLLAVAVAGCAPSRVVLTGPEGNRAEAFFAGKHMEILHYPQ